MSLCHDGHICILISALSPISAVHFLSAEALLHLHRPSYTYINMVWLEFILLSLNEMIWNLFVWSYDIGLIIPPFLFFPNKRVSSFFGSTGFTFCAGYVKGIFKTQENDSLYEHNDGVFSSSSRQTTSRACTLLMWSLTYRCLAGLELPALILHYVRRSSGLRALERTRGLVSCKGLVGGMLSGVVQLWWVAQWSI